MAKKSSGTYAKIRLEAENPKSIDFVVQQLKQVATALNMGFVGPVYLPTKELKVTVRRTPCGDGSDTYETWRKRIHRRFVIVYGDDKSLRHLLKIKVPEDVYVKIVLGQKKSAS